MFRTYYLLLLYGYEISPLSQSYRPIIIWLQADSKDKTNMLSARVVKH